VVFKLNYLYFTFTKNKELVPLTESYCVSTKVKITEVKSTNEAFNIMFNKIGGLNR